MQDSCDQLDIRNDGRLGRITLTRPKALNALSHDMCLKIEAALDRWRNDGAVDVVLIDALGDKAFCAAAISAICTGWPGREL